jgi:sec-independent protein translocase protein TatC
MAATATQEEFKEMELWEHLSELRTRLIRSVAYVILGLTVAWLVYPYLFKLFWAPIKPIIDAHPNWHMVFKDFYGGFMLQLQVSLVSGLLIAIPLITLELWGFIAPGLTRNEKKACYLVFPLSVFFFFLGVVTGYIIMGPSIQWFVGFIPSEVQLLQDPTTYIIFLVKMVLAFGICFQMPLILMFLCWIGMVTAKALASQWRICIVGCVVLAAVATPGGDPFSMFVMAVPLIILYFASLGLCAFVEKLKKRGEDA